MGTRAQIALAVTLAGALGGCGGFVYVPRRDYDAMVALEREVREHERRLDEVDAYHSRKDEHILRILETVKDLKGELERTLDLSPSKPSPKPTPSVRGKR